MAGKPKSAAFALASGTFQGLVTVSQFVRTTVRSRVDAAGVKNDGSAVLFGQLLRVDAWLRSLCKLNEPGDFQGVAAACRALLETTIDIALLSHNITDYEQVVAWEDSAKMNYAEKLVAYFARKGQASPSEHRAVVSFASNQKVQIDTLRKTFGWKERKTGKPRHPDRWTNRTLSDDVKVVDKFGHGFQFEQFYEVEYRKLCWLVHGAGLAVRPITTDHFPGLPGLLFPHCGDLAMVASEIVLRHLGAWSTECEEEFKGARVRRTIVAGQTRRVAMGLPPLSAP
jgi:Family of unknown function (DUF5677)